MFEEPFVRDGTDCASDNTAARVPDTVSGTAEAELASAQSGNPGFQFPPRVWGAMLLCYAIFFGTIFMATGGSGHARFAIAVSVLYTAMYFGLGRVFARQAGPEDASPIDRTGILPTNTGPMSAGSVYAQVLVVPLALVLFGIAIATIVVVAG